MAQLPNGNFYSSFTDDFDLKSILVQKAEKGGEQTKNILKKINKLQVPIMNLNQDWGNARDGDIYELNLESGHSSVSFCWWSADIPTEWEALNEFCDELLHFEQKVNYINEYLLDYELETEKNQSTFSDQKSLFLSYRRREV